MTPLALLDFGTGAVTLSLTVLTAALSFISPRTRASRYLTAFFACMSVETLASLTVQGGREWLSVDAIRWLHSVNMPSAYLLGPLLYGYTVALTSGAGIRIRHALPFFAVLLLAVVNALTRFDSSPTGQMIYLVAFHAWVLQGAPYLCAAAWRTYHARAWLEHLSADDAALQVAWLRRLVAVIGGFWVLGAVERLPIGTSAPQWGPIDTLICVLVTAAMVFLAWFALRQRVLVPPQLPAQLPAQPQLQGEDASAPYARSGLEPAQCVQIAAELGRLMTAEQLYVDSQFDLQALSERSGWSPNYISQALNQGLKKNFFEFVNGFRVSAARDALANPDEDRTILEIALACGFGSKSTFNTVFKRLTGLTPSEFRRTGSPVAQASAN
ncbi:MAG: AraC family transcriptional regulator [Dokdonella sp.]